MEEFQGGAYSALCQKPHLSSSTWSSSPHTNPSHLKSTILISSPVHPHGIVSFRLCTFGSPCLIKLIKYDCHACAYGNRINCRCPFQLNFKSINVRKRSDAWILGR